MKRAKQEYMNVVKEYAIIQSSLPTIIDNNADKLHEIAQKVGVSNSALSNKKHGRRDWKYEEVKKIIDFLGDEKQKNIVNNYSLVVQDILPLIEENGYRIGFIFEKAGLTVGQYQVRNRSLLSWKVFEVQRIIEVLKF